MKCPCQALLVGLTVALHPPVFASGSSAGRSKLFPLVSVGVLQPSCIVLVSIFYGFRRRTISVYLTCYQPVCRRYQKLVFLSTLPRKYRLYLGNLPRLLSYFYLLVLLTPVLTLSKSDFILNYFLLMMYIRYFM